MVVGGLLVLAGGAILGVEADIETSVDLNLELELIRSRAAKTSFFMRTNNLPLRHGFCRFRGLKSSLRQRSRDPITATKQKFFSLSFSYTGPSRPKIKKMSLKKMTLGKSDKIKRKKMDLIKKKGKVKKRKLEKWGKIKKKKKKKNGRN